MTDDLDDTERSALASEYALGLLSQAEADAVEELIRLDPTFAAEVAEWTRVFAEQAEQIEEVAPPTMAKARLERRLFGADKPRSIWARLGVLPAALGGLVAALIVLFAIDFGVINDPRAPAPAPTLAAEVAGPETGLSVAVAYVPDTDELIVQTRAGGPPEGRVLELWVIAGDGVPRSLGVLPGGEEARLTVAPDLAAALPGATLAISEEPPGGSPTGTPTGAVLGTGAVVSL